MGHQVTYGNNITHHSLVYCKYLARLRLLEIKGWQLGKDRCALQSRFSTLADLPELRVDSKCEPAGKISAEVSPIGQ